jgi:hypothetical protein
MAWRRSRAGVVAVLFCVLFPYPGTAQPFTDRGVPVWAYDAMRTLAAHGFVPDSSDDLASRRLTRMEMAVLVVRAAAQAAGTQRTPATAQDLLIIQALVREFEAELAAVGIRVDILQETLGRLSSKVRSVRVSGAMWFRYEISRFSLNNPGTGPVLPASAQPFLPDAGVRWQLTFDAGATDTVAVRLRVSSFDYAGQTVGLWGGTPPTGHQNSPFLPLGSAALVPIPNQISFFYLDWTRAWNLPLEFRVGVLGSDTWLPRAGDPLVPLSMAPARPEALQLGPIGLLFSTAKDAAGERTLRTYALPALTFTYEGGRTRVEGVVGDVQAFQGGAGSETIAGLRLQTRTFPGVIVGVTGVTDTCNGSGALDNSALVAALTTLGAGRGLARCSFVWWGGQNGWTTALNTGSTNPITNVPGSGYSLDLDAELGPDVRFQTEWGLWSDPTAQTTGTGWQAQVVFGTPGAGHPVVVVGYQSFDPAFYPPLGAAEDPVVGFIYPGGFRNAFAAVTFPPVSGWTLSMGYEAGTSLGVGPQPGAVGFGGPQFSAAVCERCSPAGQPFSGLLVSLMGPLGAQTTFHLYYYGWEINGAAQADVYRAEVSYRF